MPPPRPAPRSKGDGSAAPLIRVQSYTDQSQEEADFEERVRNNVSQYKSEKTKTNLEVLASIEKEEGEDRPDVKKLLAWAKGTRKPKTETMVVRQKKHEANIKHAVDFGGVNLVFSNQPTKETEKQKAKTAGATVKAEKKAEAAGAVSVDQMQKVAAGALGQVPNDIAIKEVKKGWHEVKFTSEVDGKVRLFCWAALENGQVEQNKDFMVRKELAPKMASFVGTLKKVDTRLPISSLLYSDSKISVFDEDPAYKSPDQNKALDETHLKVGMKALARLHAVSFLYLARGADVDVKKRLVNTVYTDTNSRNEVKQNLEARLDAIVAALQQSAGTEGEVSKVQTLKNSLFNIYKEAETPENSLLPVLCHGLPTLSNIQFKYAGDGLPVDARFINLGSTMYGSGVTDLHVFINTSGDNTAREDFLLRFVYYETFVSILKAAGEKTMLTYDDLKGEFVQKRLYGYIQSSAVLAEKSGTLPVKKTASTSSKTMIKSGTREVDSKILGKFFPKAKVTAVTGLASPRGIQAASPEGMNSGAKIRELMQKALKI